MQNHSLNDSIEMTSVFSILEFLWWVRPMGSPSEQGGGGGLVESLSTVASLVQETAKQNKLFI